MPYTANHPNRAASLNLVQQHRQNGYNSAFRGKASTRISSDTTVEDDEIDSWYADAQAANAQPPPNNVDELWVDSRDAIVPPVQTAEDLISSRTAMASIKKSVFYFSENGSPIGVGFCVENQDTAVSAAHLWEVNNQPIIKCGDVVTGYFAPPYDGETIELRVDAVDFRSDVIKFQVIRRSSTATEAFLPVHRRVLEFGTRCVSVAFQIGMEREMKGINPNTTMGIVEGSVWKIHPRHLSYSCPSFDGDSGGALILRSGEVIGIHVESISQWRARTAADRSDPNFEDDLCDSIDSLSAGLAYGAIALRLQNII